ncbi:ubiquitin-like protein [Macroventuria anomochaeta]|uniref:Ubiquitin-like protein n=1 Tax=Macroventuria anomochaeta TaxID=301207 RepID=A0ACB6SE01_9PLEO|nr:ubiquitin-like protein [Macroventuria anomochaeta]KAF2632207.1 ubiquitin-like protein [Macroventuria anomochaeta]
MTTPSRDQPSTTAQNIPQTTASVSKTEPDHDTLSSSAVEMKTLPSPAGASATTNTITSDSGAPQIAPVEFTNVGGISPSGSTQPLVSSSAAPPARNELNRTETEAALGPSTDGPAANPDNSNGPTVVIMLLLTTGARHPYKIDEKYLKKRNVTVEQMDPYNISVYTLKELIWRDWREEWEPRPTSPSSIRLIHFGRMLDDKSPLKDCRFQTEAPNVVHMTIKPQEIVDEEENAKTGKGSKTRDDGEEPTAGCRCVIL